MNFPTFCFEDFHSFYLEYCSWKRISQNANTSHCALPCTQFYKTGMIIYFKLFKPAVKVWSFFVMTINNLWNDLSVRFFVFTLKTSLLLKPCVQGLISPCNINLLSSKQLMGQKKIITRVYQKYHKITHFSRFMIFCVILGAPCVTPKI